ncbi:MAG: group 1 truncated hemoglobin [Myxococcota bacterium]
MDSTTDDDFTTRGRKGPLAPNPALWAALEGGRKLRVILEDFYTRVFADPVLAPFFHGVTKERVIDKQYSFLAEIFTGVRHYFGDRPRNAHHWMVISDELFDYRERLIERCMRDHGLSDANVAAWLAVHEVFRKQIVKDRPIPRRMAGVEMPLGGWDRVELSVGCLCDGCQQVLEVGQVATCHRRTGQAYCDACARAKQGTG